MNYSTTSYELRPDCLRTTTQLRTNFASTSYELRPNFASTTTQLRTNFASTSCELRSNFARTTTQLRTNFAPTSYELRPNFGRSSRRTNFAWKHIFCAYRTRRRLSVITATRKVTSLQGALRQCCIAEWRRGHIANKDWVQGPSQKFTEVIG